MQNSPNNKTKEPVWLVHVHDIDFKFEIDWAKTLLKSGLNGPCLFYSDWCLITFGFSDSISLICFIKIIKSIIIFDFCTIETLMAIGYNWFSTSVYVFSVYEKWIFLFKIGWLIICLSYQTNKMDRLVRKRKRQEVSPKKKKATRRKSNWDIFVYIISPNSNSLYRPKKSEVKQRPIHSAKLYKKGT